MTKLEMIQRKLDQTTDRAKQARLRKNLSGELKKDQFVQIKENRKNIIKLEELKALHKLEAIHKSIENSRVS